MSDDPHGAGQLLVAMLSVSVLIGGACIYGIAWVIGAIDGGAEIAHRRDQESE